MFLYCGRKQQAQMERAFIDFAVFTTKFLRLVLSEVLQNIDIADIWY